MSTETITTTDVGQARRIGFYLFGGLFVAFSIFAFWIMSGILPYVFTGWFQPEALGIHQLHETMASAFFWSILAGMIFTLVRPAHTISALRQTLTILMAFALLLLATGNLMEPLMLISILLVLSIVTAVLHPARADLIRVLGRVNRWSLGLVVVALIPLLSYAMTQFMTQAGAAPADPHAEVGHWAIMGGYALAIVICGLLASLRSPGWRVPAWSAGVLAFLLGLASLLLPTQASSVGTLWAALAIVWGVVFIAANELTATKTS